MGYGACLGGEGGLLDVEGRDCVGQVARHVGVEQRARLKDRQLHALLHLRHDQLCWAIAIVIERHESEAM